jgi:hypothetical protein
LDISCTAKVFVPDVQQEISVFLCGIWVCGLSSSHPFVNLGKLHALLRSFLKNPEEHPEVPANHLESLRRRTSHWTTSCRPLNHPPLFQKVKPVGWHTPTSHQNPRLRGNRIYDDHRFRVPIRYGNFDEELSMHEQNSHTEERDGRLACRQLRCSQESSVLSTVYEETIMQGMSFVNAADARGRRQPLYC